MPTATHRWTRLAFAVLALLPAGARAATYTYSPPAGGTNPRAWNDATQWSPSGVPGPGDTAIVPLGNASSPVHAGLSATGVTVQSLTVSGADSGASLTGSIIVSGGTFDWQGGVLEYLDLVVDAASTLTITGTSDHLNTGSELVLRGSGTWDGQGLLTSSGDFQNAGTFTCLGGGSTGDNGHANQGTFTNTGSFLISPGSGDVIFGWGFHNSGALVLNGGNLLLLGAGNETHQFAGGTLAGAGEVRVGGFPDGGVGGAEAQFAGLITLGNLELASGGVFTYLPSPDGGPALGVTFDGGTLTWSGGAFNSETFTGGSFVLSPGTTLQLSGDAVGSRVLNGLTLESQGTVVYTGAGDVQGSGFGTFLNAGTFVDQTDGTFDNGATAVLFNTGSLIKNGTAGTWVINGWALVNQGVLDIETGALALEAPSDNDHALLDGGTIEGPGIVRLVNATVDLYGTQTVSAGSTLELTGTSILNLDGATNRITGPGTFLWSGGTLEGDFTGSLTLDAPTAVEVTGRALKTNDAVTLTLLGTTTWEGDDGGVSLSGNLDNQGTLVIACDGYMPAANGLFTNEGTVIKSGTPGAATIEVATTNSGTVLLESGTLRYDNANSQPYRQAGGSTVLDGGALANVQAGAGDDGGDAAVELTISAGSVIGSGRVAGALDVWGTLAPGTPGSPVGLISVWGSLTVRDGGTLALDLAGPDAGAYDVVEVDGPAVLRGTLAVSFADGYRVPGTGASFAVLTYRIPERRLRRARRSRWHLTHRGLPAGRSAARGDGHGGVQRRLDGRSVRGIEQRCRFGGGKQQRRDRNRGEQHVLLRWQRWRRGKSWDHGGVDGRIEINRRQRPSGWLRERGGRLGRSPDPAVARPSTSPFMRFTGNGQREHTMKGAMFSCMWIAGATLVACGSSGSGSGSTGSTGGAGTTQGTSGGGSTGNTTTASTSSSGGATLQAYDSSLSGTVSGTGVSCSATGVAFMLAQSAGSTNVINFGNDNSAHADGLSCTMPTGSTPTKFTFGATFSSLPVTGMPYTVMAGSPAELISLGVTLPNADEYAGAATGTITFTTITQIKVAPAGTYYLVHGSLSAPLTNPASSATAAATLTF